MPIWRDGLLARPVIRRAKSASLQIGTRVAPPRPREQARVRTHLASRADAGEGLGAKARMASPRYDERVMRPKRTDVAPTDDAYDFPEEVEAEIEASIAEIERGEYVDGDEIIRELRQRCLRS